MGKGAIISGGDDGLYSIKLKLNKDRVETLLEIIDNQIAALSARLAGMEEGKEKELVKLQRSAYEKRKEYLQNNQAEDPVVSAWCADLTEDLSGTVGTIEVPGERGIVQIQAGHEDNADYDEDRDGQLQVSVAGTPESVFYNLAMLPGWQKWMPTHRHGVISNIDTDNDTCDVTLNRISSSQQDLKINQTDKLTGIAIEYMSCNSSAFENGDSVLVEFAGQKWEGAKVVGFKDNPKACGFRFKLTRGDDTLITGVSGLLTSIKLYNSDDVLISTTTPEYNADSEEWGFNLANSTDADPSGYWVDYACEDGIETQYPYKYKDSEKDEPENLIQVGTYEDIIPFWKIGGYSTVPAPGEYPPSECDLEPEVWTNGLELSFISSVSRHREIKSSVPYKVRAAFYSDVWWMGFGGGACVSRVSCAYSSNPIGVLVESSSGAIAGSLGCVGGDTETLSGDSSWRDFSITGIDENITVAFNGSNSWLWGGVTYSYRRSSLRNITEFNLTFLYD